MPKKLDLDHYQPDNLAVARRVLTDVAEHGGEESGMVRWARLVVERIEGSQTLSRPAPAEGNNERNA